MYTVHDFFIQPEDDNIKVWRYTSFTKLVSLLDSQSLYFTRADKFDDPFEGSLTKQDVTIRELQAEEVIRQIGAKAAEHFLEQMKREPERNMKFRQYHAINCWSMNKNESAAMWGQYTNIDSGIAVQSTYDKLKESFQGDERILLGVVKYIDYETEPERHRNLLERFMLKRKSYEHEQEVRALILKWPTGSGKGWDTSIETIEHGISSPVDLDTLIDCIYLAPGSPKWLTDLVVSVCRAYGYKFNITQSELDDKAIF